MTMKTITLSDEDYEFLKDLQNELNTQTTDGNATPTFWMVEEKRDVAVPDDCGTPYIVHDDGKWSLEEAIKAVEESFADYEGETRDKWEAVDKEDIGEIYDFMRFELGFDHLSGIADFRTEDVLSRDTGAFLTKRACKAYVERYGYNHREPHTYAMTAYRNPELARLLNILKNLK